MRRGFNPEDFALYSDVLTTRTNEAMGHVTLHVTQIISEIWSNWLGQLLETFLAKYIDGKEIAKGIEDPSRYWSSLEK